MEPMQPMKMEAAKWSNTSSFNPSGAAEFVPKGKMVATKEQFPDLADAFGDDAPKSKKGGGKKGKKKTVVVKATVVEDEVADDTVPWKGKPSAFFTLTNSATDLGDPTNPNNMEMNDEQWKFIFKHYPEYGANPWDMMIWLFGESKRVEDLNNQVYGKPSNSGTNAFDDEEDNEFSSNKFDKGFGKGKQANKKDTKAKDELIKEAQLKKLQELKERAGPGKTDAEREE